VFEEFATLGTIIVERGGQLFGNGTPAAPIIVTSDDAPGSFTRGHCGGIVINGRAKTNVVNSCAGDSAAAEGGAIGYYGEADDNEFNFNEVQCSGRSNSTLANFTIIGDKRVGANFPGPTSGVNFRRGTAGTMLNSIIYNMKTAALKVDDDATFQAHCSAPPATPAVFCGFTASVRPIAEGNVFVASRRPNPFH